MLIEVNVPSLPESVADATVAAIHKKVGEMVQRDENLIDLETDKVVLEVPAPSAGVIKSVAVQVGDTVQAQALLLSIDPTAKAEVTADAAPTSTSHAAAEAATSPSVRRMMSEHGLEPSQIQGSGKDGRISKEDVEQFIAKQRSTKKAEAPSAPIPAPAPAMMGVRESKRVPMSRLRQTIADRLVAAQHNAAMLTTFNEVNLQAVMDIRAKYKDGFEKKHGIKLGFMSFFTKAVVESLKRFPAVNACIDGHDVIYHGYFDVGVAVSTERGLVVPVIRDADQKSMAEIERQIVDSATRARAGKLALEEMQGGTFTITNGGVFGSLLSTPILNAPQTAILGMHKIQERPMAENGQVVIRPMMYLALSYDHRLIDGKDSVQFLVSVKSLLEEPERLLLDL